MNERKILVTSSLPQPALDLLAAKTEMVLTPYAEESLSAQELVSLSQGCRGIVSQPVNRIDAEFLDARPEIEIVAQAAVGVDNVDLEACRARGIVLTNTPGVLTAATADITLGLILAVTRRMVEGDRLVRAGGFKGIYPLFHLGWDLEGKTLGIFGLGRIGLAVAVRAQAFGLNIIYHNRNQNPEAEKIGAEYVSFERLLEDSDILSINAPLTDETTAVFDYQAFSRMKPSAFLINTGRGPIVAEADLVRALEEKLICGAGLDVYEEEPKVHPGLTRMDNVVLLPHLGSATIEVRTRMAFLAAENILAFLDGRELPSRVV